jgi:hypothetical protein
MGRANVFAIQGRVSHAPRVGGTSAVLGTRPGLKRQEFRTAIDGRVRTVGCQVLHFEDARAHCDDAATHTLGRAHIVRRISHKANRGFRPQSSANLANAFSENVDPQLALIREAAKLEILRQPRCFQLEPANRFQVTRRNSQQLSRFPQQIQYLANSCNTFGRNRSAFSATSRRTISRAALILPSIVSLAIPARSRAARKISGSVFP